MNRTKQILMKRKYSDGSVDTLYPQVRPEDVKVSSESTLGHYLTK